MARLRRVPPGRSGRVWLRHRLRAARLAADLLDRKLRVLRMEEERIRLLRQRTDARWQTTWRQADTWIGRASVLSGERDVRLSTPPGVAEVSLEWANVMGVRYPVRAVCIVPVVDATVRGPDSAALVEAGAAHRDAVEAAVAYAAAEAAGQVVAAEIATTRRRLHAITDRWVPQLEQALIEVARELDEAELAEAFRLRWAATASPRIEPP